MSTPVFFNKYIKYKTKGVSVFAYGALQKGWFQKLEQYQRQGI